MTETFVLSFDDGTSAVQESTNDCATCADLGQIECWDGSCADSEADCPDVGDCGEGYVLDCAENDFDCCLESWIGDGYPDCEDQQLSLIHISEPTRPY